MAESGRESAIAERARLSTWELMRWNAVSTPFTFTVFVALSGWNWSPALVATGAVLMVLALAEGTCAYRFRPSTGRPLTGWTRLALPLLACNALTWGLSLASALPDGAQAIRSPAAISLFAILLSSPVFGMFDRRFCYVVAGPLLAGSMLSAQIRNDPDAGLIVVGSAVLLAAILSTNRTLHRQTRAAAEGSIDREHLLAELDRRVRRDELTQAPNRLAFTELLEQSISGGSPCGVLLIDLDGFKSVNDSLGHAGGDRLLIDTVQRLGAAVGSEERVFRLGGDEFAVVVDDPSVAEDLAHAIVAALSTPFLIHGVPVHVGASVGVTTSGIGSGVDDVIDFADRAMYASKASGRNRVTVYRSELDDFGDLSRSALESALDESEFIPYYQPIVDLGTGAVVGIEALARWRHPDGTISPPERFITHIEETRLHHRLGGHMIIVALEDHGRLRAAGLIDDGARMHVNASPVQLESLTKVLEIARCAVSRKLDLAALTIEVSEAALLRNETTIEPVLAVCRSHGVRIALDDFGTGYSSLAVLREHPVEELKIDTSLVATLLTDASCRGIVAALVELTRHAGMTLSAEGVETAEQADELRRLGVHRAQGFLCAHPMTFDDLTSYLGHPDRLTLPPASPRTSHHALRSA